MGQNQRQAQARHAVWRLDGLLVSELLQAQDQTDNARVLREPNLQPYHPRNRQNSDEQAHAERPATVLRTAEEGWQA